MVLLVLPVVRALGLEINEALEDAVIASDRITDHELNGVSLFLEPVAHLHRHTPLEEFYQPTLHLFQLFQRTSLLRIKTLHRASLALGLSVPKLLALELSKNAHQVVGPRLNRLREDLHHRPEAIAIGGIDSGVVDYRTSVFY